MTGDRLIGSCSLGFPASSENRILGPSEALVTSANRFPVLLFFGTERQSLAGVGVGSNLKMLVMDFE